MAVIVPTVAASPQAAITAAPEAARFDERWAAWEVAGGAHDRAVRQKLAIAVPLLIAFAAVVIDVLLGR
jgi:hypothetical protein